MAFAGWSRDYKTVAKETGLSVATIARILGPAAPRSGDTDELFAIADACGVPRRFMAEGFEPLLGAQEDCLQTVQIPTAAKRALDADLRREAQRSRERAGPDKRTRRAPKAQDQAS